MSKFEELKIKAGVLEQVESYLNSLIEAEQKEYRVVGESTEQDTHWKTGELLWEDEEQTIPRMKKLWDYVPIPEEEYTEEKRLRIKVTEDILKQLVKLI